MWENIEQIISIINVSINKTDVLNKLGLKNNGGNFNTLTKFIRKNQLDTSHFDYKKSTKEKKIYLPKNIDDILILNSYISSNNLKKKLYKLGLKNPQCEICNQNEYWNGRRMALILDHINGDRYDNRIDNLQIVCPNCNATLDTHCRGNQEKKAGLYKEGTHIKLKECSTENCGNLIRIASSVCKNCYFKNKSRKIKISTTKRETRKSIRPPYQQLLLEIQEFGYRGTGKKYNVSDNAIRKWVKMYEKYGDNF